MMANPSLPTSFVDLSTAQNNAGGLVNIVGVVTAFLPPSPTRGTDWQSTFDLSDFSTAESLGRGFKVKVFRPQSEHPPVENLGDIVIMRSLKVCFPNDASI